MPELVTSLGAIDRDRVYWFNFTNGSVRGRLVDIRQNGDQLHGEPLPWLALHIERRRFSETRPWGTVEVRASTNFLGAELVEDVTGDPPRPRANARPMAADPDHAGAFAAADAYRLRAVKAEAVLVALIARLDASGRPADVLADIGTLLDETRTDLRAGGGA